ncbi:MAG: DUF1993 family protein [Bacteriovoracaceae bacterium]
MLKQTTFNQFAKMLHNLSKILDKAALFAEAKKIDVEVLLNSRLAPDQFNLIRQVQIACDTAKLAASRLSGKEAPIHEDKEKTLPELKKRIEDVQNYLNSFNENDFKGFEERKISHPRWEGKWLTGEDYLHQHAIPNVYFHITTAYSILRHNGVEVGKKDYLGELPYKI